MEQGINHERDETHEGGIRKLMFPATSLISDFRFIISDLYGLDCRVASLLAMTREETHEDIAGCEIVRKPRFEMAFGRVGYVAHLSVERPFRALGRDYPYIRS